jgi:hypothetical protein
LVQFFKYFILLNIKRHEHPKFHQTPFSRCVDECCLGM